MVMIVDFSGLKWLFLNLPETVMGAQLDHPVQNTEQLGGEGSWGNCVGLIYI